MVCMTYIELSSSLLLMVPFRASTTKAIEMNRAMTSSVDLGDEKNNKRNNNRQGNSKHVVPNQRCSTSLGPNEISHLTNTFQLITIAPDLGLSLSFCKCWISMARCIIQPSFVKTGPLLSEWLTYGRTETHPQSPPQRQHQWNDGLYPMSMCLWCRWPDL